MASAPARGAQSQGLFIRILLATGLLALILVSYLSAWTGGGFYLVGAMVGLIGLVVLLRKPVVGVFILMTTFLFTYPEALRGAGNITINNMLGLLLVPLMLFEMIRDGRWWPLKFKPFFLFLVIAMSLIISSNTYTGQTGASELIEQKSEVKVETSNRAQGPALVSTRDMATKYITRLIFLLLFVYFMRTNRDLTGVVLILVVAMLVTYFSVSLGAGAAGWGTGRLRTMSDAGGAVYAGRNPNKLSYFALLVLTLMWYGRRAIKWPILYPLWAALCSLTFVMIPLTGSRSGMLNLLLFVLIVLLEDKFSYRKIVGLAGIVFAVVVQLGYQTSILDLVLPAETAERLEKLQVRSEVVEDEGVAATGSLGGRFRTAQSALMIFQEHPAFGVGIGNFDEERAAVDPFGVVGPPHDSYLWALAEGGLTVFFLYLTLFAYTFLRINEIRWEYEARFGPMKLGWLVAGMRTVLIGFMFFSLFADMWYHDFFFILIGISLSLIHLHEEYATTGKIPEPFRLGGLGKQEDMASRRPVLLGMARTGA
ncbi:MAG TPA: O-antigen ligase family protein [Candidatus Binatia bacterium]